MQKKRMDIAQAFAILGLRPHSSPDQIRRAYRRLVKRWHPDQYAQHPDERAHAETTLKIINQAYAVIKIYLKTHTAESGTRPAPESPPHQPGSDFRKRYRAAFHFPGGVHIPPHPPLGPRGNSQQQSQRLHPASGFQEALKAAGDRPKTFKQPSTGLLRPSGSLGRKRPIATRGSRSMRIEAVEPVSRIRPVARVSRIGEDD